MRLPALLSLVIGLAGCGFFGTTTDGEESAVGPAETGCGAGSLPVATRAPAPTTPPRSPLLLGAVPEPDESFAVYGTLYAEFDIAPTELTIDVSGPDGRVDGELTEQYGGRIFRFDPREPLAPRTSYDLQLDWGGDTAAWSFETTDVGLPVEVGDFADRIYVAEPASATWTEPPAVGAIMASQLEGYPLFVSVDGTLEAPDRLLGRFFVRTPCFPSGRIVEPTQVFWDNPRAWIEGDEAPKATETSGGLVWDVALEGWLAPEGRAIEGLTLSAQVDTRALDAVLEDPYEGAFCDFLHDVVGVGCQECPDDEGRFCVQVTARDMVAVPASEEVLGDLGAATFDELVEVLDQLALEDPDCPDSIPNECSLDLSCATSPGGGGSWLTAGILVVAAARRRRA